MKTINPEYARKWEAGQIHFECMKRGGYDLREELRSIRRLDADPVFVASFENALHREMKAS